MDRRKANLVQRAFNTLLKTALYLVQTKEITSVNGRKLNLAETFEVMLK